MARPYSDDLRKCKRAFALYGGKKSVQAYIASKKEKPNPAMGFTACTTIKTGTLSAPHMDVSGNYSLAPIVID